MPGKFPTDPYGASAQAVEGDVSHDAVDGGAPVKIGGKANSSTPSSVATGDRVDAWLGTQGALAVFEVASPGGGGVMSVTSPSSDGSLTSWNSRVVLGMSYLFNGTGWDRERTNSDATILASAARTTTQTGADLTNFGWRGCAVVLDVTSAGTGSITLTIEGKDSVSGKYYTILAGAAVTTNSTNVYRVYPGLTAAANATANDVLPRVFRVTVTANNANSITYSVGISYQP